MAFGTDTEHTIFDFGLVVTQPPQQQPFVLRSRREGERPSFGSCLRHLLVREGSGSKLLEDYASAVEHPVLLQTCHSGG